MQGGDTGNGMMGTRTVSDADQRPAGVKVFSLDRITEYLTMFNTNN